MGGTNFPLLPNLASVQAERQLLLPSLRWNTVRYMITPLTQQVEGRKHHHCNQLSLRKASVDHFLYRCGDSNYPESFLWDECIQKTWERIVSALPSTISAFAVLLGRNTSCEEQFLTGPSHTSVMCCYSLEQEAQWMEENRQVVKANT